MKNIYHDILEGDFTDELLVRMKGCQDNGDHLSPDRDTQLCVYCYLPLNLRLGEKGIENNLIRAAGLYVLEKLGSEINF